MNSFFLTSRQYICILFFVWMYSDTLEGFLAFFFCGLIFICAVTTRFSLALVLHFFNVYYIEECLLWRTLLSLLIPPDTFQVPPNINSVLFPTKYIYKYNCLFSIQNHKLCLQYRQVLSNNKYNTNVYTCVCVCVHVCYEYRLVTAWLIHQMTRTHTHTCALLVTRWINKCQTMTRFHENTMNPHVRHVCVCVCTPIVCVIQSIANVGQFTWQHNAVTHYRWLATVRQIIVSKNRIDLLRMVSHARFSLVDRSYWWNCNLMNCDFVFL